MFSYYFLAASGSSGDTMGIVLPGSPSTPFDREHYHRIRSFQQIPDPILPPLHPVAEKPQEVSADDLPF